MTEWTQDSTVPLHGFAVCSRSDVSKKCKKCKKGGDTVQTFAHELRYPATPEPRRLAAEKGKRHQAQHMSVVFSTCRSINVITWARSIRAAWPTST